MKFRSVDNDVTEEILSPSMAQIDMPDVLGASAVQNPEFMNGKRQDLAKNVKKVEKAAKCKQSLDDPENKKLCDSNSSEMATDLGEKIVQVIYAQLVS